MHNRVVPQDSQRSNELPKSVSSSFLRVMIHLAQVIEQLSSVHLFHDQVEMLVAGKRLHHLHNIGRPHRLQQPHLVLHVAQLLAASPELNHLDGQLLGGIPMRATRIHDAEFALSQLVSLGVEPFEHARIGDVRGAQPRL